MLDGAFFALMGHLTKMPDESAGNVIQSHLGVSLRVKGTFFFFSSLVLVFFPLLSEENPNMPFEGIPLHISIKTTKEKCNDFSGIIFVSRFSSLMSH